MAQTKEKEDIDPIYTPPSGYPELTGYVPLLFDSSCSEPIVWGFKIASPLVEERMKALEKFGRVISLGYYEPSALAVKFLTPEEAVKQYGPITHQLFGPQGGWKSVIYGTTKFTNVQLKPNPELESKFIYKKEILPRQGTLEADNSWVFYELAKIRKKSRFSLEKFATLLGVPKETIRNWENRQ